MTGDKRPGDGANNNGGSNGGGMLCNLIRIMSLRAKNPLWRLVVHCVGMGFLDTIRVCMLCGVWYVRRSWTCLVR